MFAVRDRRSRKFLKTFSGSLNNLEWRTKYRLTVTRKVPRAEGQTFDRYETVHSPSRDEIHNAIFCLPGADGAKLYVSETAAGQAFYSYRYRANHDEAGNRLPGWHPISLAEACPWLELVDVETMERRRAAARRAAATRKRNARKPKRSTKRKTTRRRVAA
jgi:hypothetical protein